LESLVSRVLNIGESSFLYYTVANAIILCTVVWYPYARVIRGERVPKIGFAHVSITVSAASKE
jgi:hypothetical protein